MEPGGLIGDVSIKVFFRGDANKSGYVGHVKTIAAIDPMKALLFKLFKEPPLQQSIIRNLYPMDEVGQ